VCVTGKIRINVEGVSFAGPFSFGDWQYAPGVWSIRGQSICERSVNSRFAAQRSSLFLWQLLSAPAPRPPAPCSSPAQAFSGMSAHHSAPAHPVFRPLRSVSAPLSADVCDVFVDIFHQVISNDRSRLLSANDFWSNRMQKADTLIYVDKSAKR